MTDIDVLQLDPALLGWCQTCGTLQRPADAKLVLTAHETAIALRWCCCNCVCEPWGIGVLFADERHRLEAVALAVNWSPYLAPDPWGMS